MSALVQSIEGTWINQNGSTVELIDENGAISGFYCSNKGRSASGKRYAVSGTRNGEVLSFCVDWHDEALNLESITSFSGRLVFGAEGKRQMHTVWVLVRRWENEARTKPTGAWNAFLTNSDVFEQVL